MKSFFVFGVLLMLLCFGLGVYQHEMVHVINNSKAGMQSYFVVNALGVATVNDQNFQRDLTNLELAQSFNESVSYNLWAPLFGIMAMVFLGFIFIGTKKELN